MPFSSGSRIGLYEIEELLGTGGMGEVYKARDTRLLRPVALKVLKCARDGGSAAEALLREARAASALSHPGIATIYEAGEAETESGRVPFIAMEYVPGPTLDTFARSGSAATRELLGLVCDIAEALAEAHGRGVIHRDVKPANIVIGDGGRAKVLDFGVALQGDGDSAETLSLAEAGDRDGGRIAGTIAYMSPEQALGREVDARTDVFSLGAVLYEVLTGRRAFQGESFAATLDALLRSEPPPPHRFNADVTPELSRIVRKMLEKDRELRYRSMRDVCLDLSRARDEVGITAAAPGPEPAGEVVAVTGFVNVTRRPEDEWLGTGLTETVAADLKRIGGLNVVAGERVFEVLRSLREARPGEGDDRIAEEAGRRVGAHLIVTGAYQRLGEQLRITARVVSIASGELVRAVKVDGRLGEVFDLEDRVAQGLATALGRPGAGRSAVETNVIEAYEARARGLIDLRAGSLAALERGVGQFERAVALDPAYVAAHVALGSALGDLAEYTARRELGERAVVELRRALELRPATAEAHRLLAYVLLFLGRDEEALEAARRAVTLAPGEAAPHAALARVAFIGKALFADAALEYRTALSLNPEGGWIALQLAHCLAFEGDLAGSEEAAHRAVELQEQLLSGKDGLLIIGGHTRLAQVRALQGRHEEAVLELEREMGFLAKVDHALRGRTTVEILTRLGGSLLHLGRSEEGNAALDRSIVGFEERLRKGADDPFTRYYAAVAEALRGETGRALDHLSEAARVRPAFTLRRALLEPDLAPLRHEARFSSLLASAGIGAG